MRAAVVSSVAPGSAAEQAGLLVGDELITVSGRPVRDVIEYRWATDEAEVGLEVRRGGLELTFEVSKAPGAPLGVEVDSPVFDEVRTVTTTASSASSTSCLPVCVAASTSRTTTTGCRSSTATSRPSRASPRPTSSGW
ncbi:MAG: PDZ domain-containing protein [Microthrixaceae bacterium]|nr:PDZ domain-containing protein [Microthrixaceae bacterium]